jgi:uncharacterized Zn-finger protein
MHKQVDDLNLLDQIWNRIEHATNSDDQLLQYERMCRAIIAKLKAKSANPIAVEQTPQTETPSTRSVQSPTQTPTDIQLLTHNHSIRAFTESQALVENCDKEIKIATSTEKEGLYACNDCDKVYKNRCSLNDHRRLHDGTAFKCDECAYIFNTRQALDRHVRAVHTNDRPFACDSCMSKFALHASLSHHKRIVHEQVRNFECDYCQRRFNSSSTLRAHRRRHTGERPYACDECAEAFNRMSALRTHRHRQHSEQLPYKFDQCDKSFAHSRRLVLHQLRVHK